MVGLASLCEYVSDVRLFDCSRGFSCCVTDFRGDVSFSLAFSFSLLQQQSDDDLGGGWGNRSTVYLLPESGFSFSFPR